MKGLITKVNLFDQSSLSVDQIYDHAQSLRHDIDANVSFTAVTGVRIPVGTPNSKRLGRLRDRVFLTSALPHTFSLVMLPRHYPPSRSAL
jgi:uncharacterized protein YydD (DUF2326 family)